nr:immunoglobulin heavy chain junction region [Mus musculus]
CARGGFITTVDYAMDYW